MGCYVNGKVQYERLAETDLFRQGIERVRAGVNKYRLALMCAEKDPLDCHRTILVARHVSAQDFTDQLLSGEFPWSRLRSAQKLLGLAERYGAVRLDAACQRALRFELLDVYGVDALYSEVGETHSMACDNPEGQPMSVGSNISLAIGSNDSAGAQAMFEKMSDGGNVTLPMQQTFWAERFAMVTGKFGINWMFNCNKGESDHAMATA